MIRVTVELVPHGDESRKETISVMQITNDQSGTQEHGNYRYALDYGRSGDEGNFFTEGVVRHHRRSFPIWDLIRKVIGHADIETNFLDDERVASMDNPVSVMRQGPA